MWRSMVKGKTVPDVFMLPPSSIKSALTADISSSPYCYPVCPVYLPQDFKVIFKKLCEVLSGFGIRWMRIMWSCSSSKPLGSERWYVFPRMRILEPEPGAILYITRFPIVLRDNLQSAAFSRGKLSDVSVSSNSLFDISIDSLRKRATNFGLMAFCSELEFFVQVQGQLRCFWCSYQYPSCFLDVIFEQGATD